VLRDPIEQEAGRVAIPTGPGLGIDIDRDILEEFRA
jgi:D-galactarolactone cycloisomerase